ncbi:serine/threonine-protein kinase [Nonomuraea sediminis]|uniref:serine/threonine-protein kinase n=1 Tax=Nonomuraea sediminis TaxID=2835864 RepID=UPI001BDC3F8C|nr:serine/threonine-protein kinase [Nonomuraea sediminis]
MESVHAVAGRYRLEERIGSGGNGAVWRAVDEELGRVVAVKRALTGDDRRATLLRREARILARVSHPNVVTVYDLVPDGGAWWLVMEYVPARSLAEHGRLPPARVAEIGAQLARGLRAVHEAGVLHRDVKPGNVLLSDDGQAKLGDFGISRSPDGEITITDAGTVIGTPAYVAPEVANGADPSPASDVFSLGATLFAAVEGRSPYGASGSPMAALRRAMAGRVERASHAGALTPVLVELLRRDPARRPTLADAERLLTTPPRLRLRRWALACLAAAVAVALTVWLLSFRAPPRPPAPPAVRAIADPCALVGPGVLSRYGKATVDAHYGNFNRCDVIIRRDPAEVDVKIELVPTADPAEQDETSCSRSTTPVGGHAVQVTAELHGKGRADLCAIADTATTAAAARLARGPLPSRTPEPASLAAADACALLRPADLARLPGLDARPEVGFGRWECRWRDPADRSWLLVRFDQNAPLGPGDGRHVRLAGHDAYVEQDGYGEHTCAVRVVHRTLTDGGQPVAELLLVAVFGSSGRLCDPALDLARTAAARLPATAGGSATSPSAA